VPAGARRARLPHEVAAGVNFAGIEEEVDAIAGRLLRRLEVTTTAVAESLEAHLRSLPDGRSMIDFLGGLDDPARANRWPGLDEALGEGWGSTIAGELDRAVDDGVLGVLDEARRQGTPILPGRPDLNDVQRRTLALGGDRLARMPTHRVSELARNWIHNFPVYNFADTPDQLLRAFRGNVVEVPFAPARESDIRAEVQKAHGMGRAAGATGVARPARTYASELLDRSTCGPCSLVDGREYASEAAARLDYPTGIYRACEGGARCRGTLVFVWGTEEPPTEGGFPPAPVGRGGRPGDPIVDLGSDPTAPRYALNRATLRDVHGIELADGQRIRLLGGHLHHEPLVAGYVEARRGRLLYVGDGLVDTPEEMFGCLDALADRIPEGMGEALELIGATPQINASITGLGEAMATSNGTEIVFWNRYSLDPLDSLGETFDHELGHSVIGHWNRGGATTRRTVDTNPNPNDPIWRVSGQGSHPGGYWQEAARIDAERAEEAFRRHAEVLRRASREVRADPTGAGLTIGEITPGRLADAIDRRVEELIGRMRPANRDALRTIRTRFAERDLRPANQHVVTPNGRGRFDGVNGDGVSDYGAHKPEEDWAEAFRLYLRDQHVGHVGFAPGLDAAGRVSYGAGTPTTFRHLYPHRAELLDALFDAYRRAAATGAGP
jgi:hypothetical protein